MWVHVLLFATWHTSPYVLLFFSCHCNSSTILGDWYIHFSLGIIGKCRKILSSTYVQPTCLNLALPHFGQCVEFAYGPLYNTHPTLQAWICLYFRPMCCVNVLAKYMLTNKVLSAGNKKLCRRANNLSNLFEQLCTIHMFVTISTTANFVQHAPSYKGTYVVYSVSNPSNTSLSSRPTKYYGMWLLFMPNFFMPACYSLYHLTGMLYLPNYV